MPVPEDDDVVDDRPAADQAADAAQQATSQATTTQTTTADTGADAAQAAASAAATAANTAQTGQTATTAAPAAGTQAADPTNIREFAASLGLENARTFSDDKAFTQALINLAQQRSDQLAQAQRMAQYGQLWIDHQAKQQQQQAPAAAAPNPLARYKAPEYDPRWEHLIQRDPNTGAVIGVVAGADPTILPKYHAYRQHRDRVADELLRDPESFLDPLISDRVAKQAAQLVEERVAQMQTAQRVEAIVARNRDWAFAKDAKGQQQFNFDGSPMLTQQGARYKQFVEMTWNAGVKNEQWQDFFARNLLVAEMNMANQANQIAQQNGNQQRQDLVNNMNRKPNASGSMVGADNTGHQAPAVQNESLSLRDQLAAAFKREGMTDEMLAADERG